MTTHGGEGRHGYSLTLKPSVISTAGSVAPMDLTDMARNWTRSIRLQGGFWSGSFTITENKRIFSAFDTWLGCHVEERSGGMVTWEGLVYEMELSTGGFVYRISLDTMWNKVRADFDPPGRTGDAWESDWETNDLAIARFGTKELLVPVDTTVPEVADRVRDMYVAEYGWPHAKIVGVCPPDREQLSVVVNGYAFLLNWKYNSGGACWEFCDDPVIWPPGCDSDTPSCDVQLDSNVANWEYDFVNNIWEDTTVDFTPYQTVPPGAPATDITQWARCCLYINTDGGHCWMYLGELNGDINHIDCYSDPALQVPGYNVVPGGGVGFMGTPLDPWYLISHGTTEWIRTMLATDWVGTINAGSIQENRIQVFRYSGNRADISGERAWEAMQRCISLSDWNYNPWRVWVGPGRFLNYEPISTTPVAYVLDGHWKADPAGTPINAWQLRPGVGKVLNYRWSPPRNGYWLEDPALFLMEEVNVDQDGTIQPSMAEISQTENLLTWLSALPKGSRSGIGGEGPLPPNWNVEAGKMNPLGPGGDMHGYWTVDPNSPTGYTWVHDDSIDLSGYY